MSYQPEPDYEKECPKLFALRDRVVKWHGERPVLFWFLIWLTCSVVTLLTYAEQSAHQMQRPSFKAFTIYATLGWIHPFWIWIDARKDRQS
ncbi:hypothetical protein OO25_13045 [Phaeobacter sp. S60]|nr:hypothetical protein OO25_13045 [Phaeobacter sp. S60]